MLKDDWNRAEIDIVVARLIEQNPDKAQQAKERPPLIGWFVGQTMKRLLIPADPKLVLNACQDRLSRFVPVTNGIREGEG
jgi:Asp-tRNA(Asn)/Glu-tRNA(Gln) amidotransferase B subunit